MSDMRRGRKPTPPTVDHIYRSRSKAMCLMFMWWQTCAAHYAGLALNNRDGYWHVRRYWTPDVAEGLRKLNSKT